MDPAKQSYRAVVDNWLLELGIGTLVEGFIPIPSPKEQSAITLRQWADDLPDKSSALLQLLDLVVCYDELLVDSRYAYTWQRFQGANDLSFIQTVDVPYYHFERLRDADTEAEPEDWKVPHYYDRKHIDMVADGARYYLNLSRVLGLHYWPSPRRAAFLADRVELQRSYSAAAALDATMRIDASKLLAEALVPLNLVTPEPLRFPGFGATALTMASRASEILPAARELRESKTAVAFRRWLSELERAVRSGDALTLARAASDYRDVFASFRRDLGVGGSETSDPQITVGVSPTLTVSSPRFRKWLESLTRRPDHLVFLREHFRRSFASVDVIGQLKRLFPRHFVSDSA